MGTEHRVGRSLAVLAEACATRNVRADECSAPGTGLGAMMVRFKGDEYAIVGVYFAAVRRGQHELCYVLVQNKRA